MRTSCCVRLLLGVSLFALSAVAAAQNAVTTRAAELYAGPDDSYPIVAQLDVDAPVQVTGCLGDWSWCDVTIADNRGWVYAPDLIYDYEGGYVPLYAYAPSLSIPVVQFTIGEYWDQYYYRRPWYAQRDEWLHREPPHHRRPPGPPPSAGPPPRSAREDRRSHETQPERPLRLGSAEPPHKDVERSPRDVEPPHRDVERQERAGPPPHEEHPPGRGEPQRREEHALPQRADGARHEAEGTRHEPGARPEPEEARHEETRRGEKSDDRPTDAPR